MRHGSGRSGPERTTTSPPASIANGLDRRRGEVVRRALDRPALNEPRGIEPSIGAPVPRVERTVAVRGGLFDQAQDLAYVGVRIDVRQVSVGQMHHFTVRPERAEARVDLVQPRHRFDRGRERRPHRRPGGTRRRSPSPAPRERSCGGVQCRLERLAIGSARVGRPADEVDGRGLRLQRLRAEHRPYRLGDAR